jgi:hypothetical protein
MNPAHISTAQPPSSHLNIIKLEVPQQDGRRYDVMLQLCRPLTSYENHELIAHRSIGLDASPDDPSQLIATHTTIEEVRDRLPEFHELLTAAAVNGHAAQDTATRVQEALDMEEARRQALVSDINACLGACSHTHDPAVGAV